ncbi:hypothetical protein [Amycolatopsis mediterranei]|uniref:Uncharacterized protein n=2 Tax=Amycolatopsis mediterranei TaxID=33910 RepID=A0A9R0UB67_AMYMS|nr:hypothetical protein RAM_29625 [Amycolatopsis mediterranei S699]KDO12823.1 hypothetical protein DV26_00080 [Amycolatopsis mediterranei]
MREDLIHELVNGRSRFSEREKVFGDVRGELIAKAGVYTACEARKGELTSTGGGLEQAHEQLVLAQEREGAGAVLLARRLEELRYQRRMADLPADLDDMPEHQGGTRRRPTRTRHSGRRRRTCTPTGTSTWPRWRPAANADTGACSPARLTASSSLSTSCSSSRST